MLTNIVNPKQNPAIDFFSASRQDFFTHALILGKLVSFSILLCPCIYTRINQHKSTMHPKVGKEGIMR